MSAPAREQPRSGNAAPAAAVTPPNGVTWRSYYYAGSTRVAVRTQTPTTNVVYPGLRWAQPRAGFWGITWAAPARPLTLFPSVEGR